MQVLSSIRISFSIQLCYFVYTLNANVVNKLYTMVLIEKNMK